MGSKAIIIIFVCQKSKDSSGTGAADAADGAEGADGADGADGHGLGRFFGMTRACNNVILHGPLNASSKLPRCTF